MFVSREILERLEGSCPFGVVLELEGWFVSSLPPPRTLVVKTYVVVFEVKIIEQLLRDSIVGTPDKRLAVGLWRS